MKDLTGVRCQHKMYMTSIIAGRLPAWPELTDNMTIVKKISLS